MRPPQTSIKTEHLSASQKKNNRLLSTSLAIGGIFFDPRSTFDLVTEGRTSIFGKTDVFQLNNTIATQL